MIFNYLYHKLIYLYRDYRSQGLIRALNPDKITSTWIANFQSVIDGETIEVMADGYIVQVRLLFIDTPKNKMGKGQEAKIALSKYFYEHIQRTNSTVLTMIGGNRDKKGRFLCIVKMGSIDESAELLQTFLLENGYSALDEKWFKAPDDLRDDWLKVQAQARMEGRNSWAKDFNYMLRVFNSYHE